MMIDDFLMEDIYRWLRKHKAQRVHYSAKCLVYNHLAGRYKRERNRQWMLNILREMQRVRAVEFWGNRQRLMARNYPKPS